VLARFPSIWFGIVLVLLAITGTVRSPAQHQPWKFVLFADSRGDDFVTPVNTNILSELARAVVREYPDFLLFGGDFAYFTTFAELQLWTNALSPVYAAGIPVYPTLGNHEVDRAAFGTMFAASLPTNGPRGGVDFSYYVQHQNALILLLDHYVPTNQLRVSQIWVDAVLSTNSMPHVFAFGHAPAFKLVHNDCLGSYPNNRDLFWNSLSNAHSRIYFSGHDHLYDRARLEDQDGKPSNDIQQIIVGTAGGPLYPDYPYDGINSGWVPVRAFHEMQFGYETVEIDGDRVTCTWFHRTAPDNYEVADVFRYSIAPLPVLTFQYSSYTLTLFWSPTGILQSASSPTSTFTNLTSAGTSIVITNLEGPATLYRVRGQ